VKVRLSFAQHKPCPAAPHNNYVVIGGEADIGKTIRCRCGEVIAFRDAGIHETCCPNCGTYAEDWRFDTENRQYLCLACNKMYPFDGITPE